MGDIIGYDNEGNPIYGEAPKKETPKKEKITFIPTDEDAARLLYGEKRKQKHTYTDVLKRS